MNCKKGDLAMIIGGVKGTQIGKIVTCLELVPPGTEGVGLRWGPLWRVDQPINYSACISNTPSIKYVAPDMTLMPINPLDDEREIECTAVSEKVGT
jgi:hypothetical protein